MANIPVLAQTRIFPFARIRRERVLRARGEVIVQNGARVGALDVVARADTVGNIRAVPLARYLQVPETALGKHMRKEPGERVDAREIIASKPELFGTLQRIYRAPGAGKIATLQGAWLVMDLLDAPFELKALYRGTVVNVMPRLGVVIEAVGALAQGVWGTGEGYGVLKKMTDSPGAILREDKIDVVSRGAILLVGAGLTEEAIRRAAQERVAGLVVGGLTPRCKELVESLNLPTLVTDGFGERAMSAPIFDLLASHDGEETSIVSPFMPRAAARPEVFIPMMASSSSGGAALPPPTLVAQVGARVRMMNESGQSEIGKIADIPKSPRTIESGLTTWGAEVERTTGSSVFVPWENLELID
jgi:hypothetical protein